MFLSSANGPRLYHLKLTSDQRSIVFDVYESSSENDSLKSGCSEVRSLQPIDMTKIVFFEVDQGGDKKGNKNDCRFFLDFKL
jgi:hypothetical protein